MILVDVEEIQAVEPHWQAEIVGHDEIDGWRRIRL
jgi:hypothetical protein